jgi:hypothetical protein
MWLLGLPLVGRAQIPSIQRKENLSGIEINTASDNLAVTKSESIRIGVFDVQCMTQRWTY